MNQIYKKDNFIVIPVQENFIIINKNKVFKDGHTHVKKIGIARLLIDLAISKELPQNDYFAESLIRISEDSNYIKKINKFRDKNVDFEELMKHDSYKRVHGAMRQVGYE